MSVEKPEVKPSCALLASVKANKKHALMLWAQCMRAPIWHCVRKTCLFPWSKSGSWHFCLLSLQPTTGMSVLKGTHYMPQWGRWSVESCCSTGETHLIFMIFVCACVWYVCKCVYLPMWTQVHSPEDDTGCPVLPFCLMPLRQDLSPGDGGACL